MKILGWVLLIVGVIMLLVRNINYTTREKVVKIGRVEVSRNQNHLIAWPYYTGAVLAVAGVAFILIGSKRS
jgi:hypothetical protein